MQNAHRVCQAFAFVFAALTALLFNLGGVADGYPLGSMTCDDIGKVAESIVKGKNNGLTIGQALVIVKNATGDDSIERKNLTRVVRAIYTEAWAINLSESGAKMAFAADCKGQAQLREETPAAFKVLKVSWTGDALGVELKTSLPDGVELNLGISNERTGDNLISDVVYTRTSGGSVVVEGFAKDRDGGPIRPGQYWLSIAKGSDILPLAAVVPITIPKRPR